MRPDDVSEAGWAFAMKALAWKLRPELDAPHLARAFDAAAKPLVGLVVYAHPACKSMAVMCAQAEPKLLTRAELDNASVEWNKLWESGHATLARFTPGAS